MGLAAECTARWRGKSSEGKARLEQHDLVFRGAFRLAIPLAEVKSAEAKRGNLRLKFAGGTAMFALGAAAEKWALKIRYPRSRIEKLGVKPDSLVSLVGVNDSGIRQELRARGAKVAAAQPRKNTDFIFFQAEDRTALQRMPALSTRLAPAGALWIVYPKGRTEITENHVMAAGKAAGLVDVKVVSFSDTHTALKFVIPLSRRP